MRQYSIQFANLQEMVAFLKQHKFTMHNYNKDKGILMVQTEESIDEGIAKYRGTVLEKSFDKKIKTT